LSPVQGWGQAGDLAFAVLGAAALLALKRKLSLLESAAAAAVRGFSLDIVPVDRNELIGCWRDSNASSVSHLPLEHPPFWPPDLPLRPGSLPHHGLLCECQVPPTKPRKRCLNQPRLDYGARRQGSSVTAMRSGTMAVLTSPGEIPRRIMTLTRWSSPGDRRARASSIAAIAARAAAPSPSSPRRVMWSRNASAAVKRRASPSSRTVIVGPAPSHMVPGACSLVAARAGCPTGPCGTGRQKEACPTRPGQCQNSTQPRMLSV
jgi:hypothetical protein